MRRERDRTKCVVRRGFLSPAPDLVVVAVAVAAAAAYYVGLNLLCDHVIGVLCATLFTSCKVTQNIVK